MLLPGQWLLFPHKGLDLPSGLQPSVAKAEMLCAQRVKITIAIIIAITIAVAIAVAKTIAVAIAVPIAMAIAP